jgi:uncharacterized protein (TIGR02271 family)
MSAANMGSGPGSGGMDRRTVTAMFDSRSDAEEAVNDLIEAGFSRDDIRMMPGREADSSRTTGDSSRTTGHVHADSYPADGGSGFWEALSDFFFPDSDRHVYAEGLHRGGFLVAVTTSAANYDQAVDILDDEGTIDLDEREASWRSQGWSGYAGASSGTGMVSGTGGGSAGAGSMGSASVGRSGMSDMTTGTDDDDRLGMVAPSEGTTDTSLTGRGGMGRGGMGTESGVGRTSSMGSGGIDQYSGMDSTGPNAGSGLRGSGSMSGSAGMEGRRENEAVIPVAEERLRVGKRDVEGGRVRVRSYVVEEPVREDVQLRREHVDIERRPVDRPLGSAEDAFRDRTVELTEHAEEPVVQKEARIREEVVLRKDVDSRTETVSDTVRRTEVEVEDERRRLERGTGTGSSDRK